jgi:hypothetical protein
MLWFEMELRDRPSLASLAEGLGEAAPAGDTLAVTDPNGLSIRFVARP